MIARRSHRPRGGALRALVALGTLLAALVCAGPALAAESAHWDLEVRPAPTNLPKEGKGIIVASINNIGDVATGGGQHIKDVLPEGVEATESSLRSKGTPVSQKNELGDSCSKQTGAEVECSVPAAIPPTNRSSS